MWFTQQVHVVKNSNNYNNDEDFISSDVDSSALEILKPHNVRSQLQKVISSSVALRKNKRMVCMVLKFF